MTNFYTLQDSANFYAEVMKIWIKYKNIFNLDYHIIRYEDLISNFDHQVGRLTDFLNLDFSDEMKNYFIQTAVQNYEIINGEEVAIGKMHRLPAIAPGDDTSNIDMPDEVQELINQLHTPELISNYQKVSMITL